MNASRRYILLLVLIAGILPSAWAQEAAPAAAEKPAEKEVDPQISINKKSLLEGDEQTRLVAAGLLLKSDHPQARKELLDVLGAADNPQAQVAVCRALTTAREDRVSLPDRNDFIEPLIGVLKVENDPGRAELAAQALLMFPYESVAGHFEELTADANMPETARVNAVRALKYQPDDRAIFKLIDLLGADDPNLVTESRKSLEFLGIQPPSDPNGIQALRGRLSNRGPEAFLRNPLVLRIWLVSRESRIKELSASVDAWEQRYLGALDKLYLVQPDEKASSEFLTQQLNSPDASVKLWALGKVEELRTGTDKGKILPQLEGSLLALISNPDRRVRLRIAGLLTLMSELNAAKPLLDQIKVEDDPEVRHGLFVALGTACYYASSTVKVPQEIRRETLELAVGFLDNADPEKVRSGADVIRKLLEQNGLKPEDIDKYLTALATRYGQASPAANHGLRAEILGAMAGLCGPRSVCRPQAAKLYGPVFEKALSDELETVRQAAVDGLSNIDKAAALKRLVPNFVNDPSAAVRARIINLAGEVGGPGDLEWLFKKVGKNGEDGVAWSAVLKILRRAEADVVGKWLASLAPDALSPDRRINVATVLEQKAQAQKKADELEQARFELFSLYSAKNDTARAVAYMDLLLGGAADADERQDIARRLLDICLRPPASRIELAGVVVGKFLAEADLSGDQPLAAGINEYLTKPPAGADPNALLAAVRKIPIETPESRKGWRALLSGWEAFAKAQTGEKTDKATN